MSNRHTTTIFRQLILNIIIPVVLALLVLAFLNYSRTKELLIAADKSKSEIISDEIRGILELQDIALDIIEKELNHKLEGYSDKLTNHYLLNADKVEDIDLEAIRLEMGMDELMEDIYIINTDGRVVNTTFEKDANLNFFDFGEDVKQFLLSVFDQNRFISERFTIEGTTKRIKKYTYESSADGNYIIELGIYSPKADNVIEAIRDRLRQISEKQKTIHSVDLFLGSKNPFSLNKSEELTDDQRKLLVDVFEKKENHKLQEKKEGKTMSYEYIYMNRENTSLYKDAVIRIVSDKTDEIAYLRNELLKSILIFSITILAVIVLIYKKTQVITLPIKKLVNNVNRITNGNLHERATVEGNNEITRLSEQFNVMLKRLEELYNGLEKKVQERTMEISKQKEKIESQRDNLAEKNVHIQAAYQEIEEQKKHIMDSIHYAKRIQNAILPPDDFVNNVLPNSFILYKPKDIVSGDFYWVDKKEDTIYFAAVDCTGHGVPGAFMSIVGNNQLNYALNVQGVRKAAEILDELNHGVTQVLHQKKGTSSVKDGMDIALCSINYKKNELQYAGAYNPLYHFRNNELSIIKGNKFPIGDSDPENVLKYENHEIKTQKGDTFYIFSDGFADQFGGPKGKKLKYNVFREKLAEIQDKPMNEQKEILDEFITEWMGNIEQIDDILVIGVKI